MSKADDCVSRGELSRWIRTLASAYADGAQGCADRIGSDPVGATIGRKAYDTAATMGTVVADMLADESIPVGDIWSYVARQMTSHVLTAARASDLGDIMQSKETCGVVAAIGLCSSSALERLAEIVGES